MEVIHAASAHLKRGCFDAFKIIVRETVDHYEELRRIDTSIVDNGELDKGMRQLISEIRARAVVARQAEGDSRDKDKWHEAFELWQPVYVECVRFDQEYFLNDKVQWARRKQAWRTWRHRVEGVVVSVVAGLIVWGLIAICSAK